MLVFEEREKPEYPEKNLSEQSREPTYDAESGNRTRDTLVEGERSHHCAKPAPLFLIAELRKVHWVLWTK